MIVEIVKGLSNDELKIVGPNVGSLISDLCKVFSASNPGAFFQKQYGYAAPSKIYAVNQFGFFNDGLIFEVLKYIKLNYPSATIKLADHTKTVISNRLPLRQFASNYTGVENISTKIEFRPYQIEAINAVIKQGYGRCMFECPTGSGKSFIIANLIHTLKSQYNNNIRTLLFLPNSQLVSQFTKDLADYGYTDKDMLAYTPLTIKKHKTQEFLDCPIIISNRQFLLNRLKQLGKFDLLIVDEVHSCSPGSKTETMIKSISAPMKVGCSGTVPTDKLKYWNLLHLFGPVVYRESITKLQSEGYLTGVKFTLIKVKDMVVERNRNLLFNLHPLVKYSEDSEIAFNAAYTAETEYMSENCMNLYSPVLQQMQLAQGNTLILFDRIEFGKALFEFLKTSKYNDAEFYYIDGSIAVDDRETVRAACENNNNVIVVAQVSIMSVGINIKNLTNLIMTGSNKSHSRTIQAIGRLLRLHENKSHAHIYDIVFYNCKYSKRHYNERRELYKKYYNKHKPDDVVSVTLD